MSGVNRFDVRSASRIIVSILSLLNLNKSNIDITLSFQQAAFE